MADPNLENKKDNEVPQEPQKNQDEPVISPKDNDELLIEIDDNQKTNISEEINEVNQEIDEELGENPIENEEFEPNTPPKSKKGIYIIILLIVIGAAGYVFVMKPDLLAKKFPILVEKGIIKLEGADSVKTQKIAEPIQIKPEKQEIASELPEGTVTKEEIDTKTQEEKVIEKEVVSAITEDLNKQEAIKTPEKTAPKSDRIAKKGKLQTPCWIISYSSISKEATAIKTVAKLTTEGKKCGYYWIPDYIASGPQLFKIYIGPFTSKEEAQSQLASIQSEVSGAYVAEVK